MRDTIRASYHQSPGQQQNRRKWVLRACLKKKTGSCGAWQKHRTDDVVGLTLQLNSPKHLICLRQFEQLRQRPTSFPESIHRHSPECIYRIDVLI